MTALSDPAAARPPALVAEGVTKTYRLDPSGRGGVRLRHLGQWGRRVPHTALEGIDLAVAPGETIGLIGPNGSGKSTLLRVLAGVTRPTTGAVRATGRLAGILTLQDGLADTLTGRENAITLGMLAGLDRRAARRRLDEVAAFAELGDAMEDPVRTYSSGMRLRLAFASAITLRPDILLVDEILSVGDLRFQHRCFQRLQELQDAGTTIVLASHDLDQVRRLCSTVVWLQRGRARAVGAPRDVIERYRTSMTEGLQPQLSDAGIRLGTGRVVLSEVRVVDASGASLSSMAPGAALHVEMDYRADEPVDDVIFAVALQRADVPELPKVVDVSTHADGVGTGRLAGTGTVVLAFERLDLAPGQYTVEAGVYATDWERVYDFQAPVAEVDVRGTSGEPLLAPPHAWRLGPVVGQGGP